MNKADTTECAVQIEVHHVELAEIGGLKMLVISSKFVTGQVEIPEISMITVQKGRLMRMRLNSPTGALAADSNRFLDAFLSGLNFEK